SSTLNGRCCARSRSEYSAPLKGRAMPADMPADPGILADVLKLVDALAGDWEHEGVVTPQTRFIADLGLESLDLVVLGTLLQQEHGPLPFAEFLAELGTRPVEARDVTVLELVDFISVHRSVPASRGGL